MGERHALVHACEAGVSMHACMCVCVCVCMHIHIEICKRILKRDKGKLKNREEKGSSKTKTEQFLAALSSWRHAENN